MLYGILGLTILDIITNYTVLNMLVNKFSYDIVNSGYKAKYDDLIRLIYNDKKYKKSLIPFYGTYLTLLANHKYRNASYRVINYLISEKVFEKLTLEDKKLFDDNPTPKTAKKINEKFENDLKNSAVMTYIDENDNKTTIYYTISGDPNDFKINITAVYGALKDRNYSEIRELVLNKWEDIYDYSIQYTESDKTKEEYEEKTIEERKELLHAKQENINSYAQTIYEFNEKDKTIGLTEEEIKLFYELKEKCEKEANEAFEIAKTFKKTK